MKILIVTGIFPPSIGGPSTYVPRIASGLIERGHQVTVFTLCNRTDKNDGEYPFDVVKQPRETAFVLRAPATIRHLVRLGRTAEILFVNGLAFEATLANLFLKKPLVLKVVGDLAWERATNNGRIIDGFETFQTTKYGIGVELLKRLRSWWTRRATCIVVPSRYLARCVAGWGIPESKIRVIYNAVDQPNGIGPVHIELKTQWRLVSVGRLVSWKRVDILIKALVQLEQTGLVVIGDGPERSNLEELVRLLNLQERVRFTGQKSREETLSLMETCQLFVLNSTYEGLPHSALEAMSLGVPVIASAVGGTPEIVKDGDNGRLIDPVKDNEKELTKVIREVLSVPNQRERLSEGALRTAHDHNLSQMVEATEAELTTCFTSSSRQPRYFFKS